MTSTTSLTNSETEQSRFRNLRVTIHKGIRSKTIRSGLCAVVDQAITSGGRFLATILVGRACGAEGLGLYSLGISVAMIALAIQHSIITAPYTVYIHQLDTEEQRSRYSGSMLIIWLTLACGIGILLAVASIVISQMESVEFSHSLVSVLAIGVPFLLLREFSRQLAFANLRLKSALQIDIAAVTLQTITLVLLMTGARLTPVSAWWSVITAYAITCGTWFYLNRMLFKPLRSNIHLDLQKNWRIGRWDMASSVLMNCQLYLMHWCLAWWIGIEATGEYAACATVLLFSNPIIMGLGNYLMPKVSRTLSKEGLQAMTRFVCSATLILGGAMIAFSAVAVLCGPTLLEVLFQIDSNAAHRSVIALLATSATVGALGVAPEWALLAMEKPRTTFRASCIGLAVTSLTAVISVSVFGVIGAAAALLLGTLLCVSYIWIAFYIAVREQPLYEISDISDRNS